jgi:lysophospholipase L1-like esterase
VIDFDLATRDPADPLRLLPAYDPGDHVHPNDLGNQAMANVISPLIFASDTRRDGAAHGRQTPAADGR